MKIRIDRDALADALNWTARALAGRGGSSGIGIEASGDSVTFTAFDRETSARAEFEAVVEVPGSAVVPGRLLSDISKTLPAAPVVLQLVGSAVELTCGRTSFHLPVVEAGDFPAMLEMPPAIGAVVGADFAAAVGQVSGSASMQDNLKHLTGVRVEFASDVITLAATDRFRLAVRELGWRPEVSKPNNAVLIPAARLADISKGLADCDEVNMYAPATGATNLVGFSGKSKSGATRSIVTNLLDAQFPERYRDLLPAESTTTAYLSTNELLNALKRVRLVLDSGSGLTAAFVAIKIKDGELLLSAKGSLQADANEAVPCENVGEIDRVQFNPGFFIDGLTALGTPYVRLGFTQEQKPVLISGTKEAGAAPSSEYRYLLMPMRGNA